MRRSEDRLLTTVYWALGTVGTVVLALIAYNWRTTSHLGAKEKKELAFEMNATFNKRFAETDTSLQSSLGLAKMQFDTLITNQIRDGLHKYQAEGIAFALNEIAQLRIHMSDAEGAVRACTVMYSAAKIGNTNYIAHALDRLAEAFELVRAGKCIVPDALTDEVRALLYDYPGALLQDPRAKRLRALLDGRTDPSAHR